MDAHRELDLPGASLRYRDEGAGRAMVFVHGWTLDLDVWEPQAPLAARLRVVRYDRRGFGLSTGQPSLEADIADLAALLDALGVTSPVLVGMSQGARVVLEFAARHPEIAGALVLDGPPPLSAASPDDEDELPIEAMRRVAARDGIAAFRALWTTHPLARLVTTDAQVHALLARIIARYPGKDLLAAQVPVRESIDEHMLARIGVPALIINGALDTDTRRRAGLRLRQSLENADRVLIPEAAHLPNLDAPQTYNQLMLEFARRHLPAAA